MNLWSRYKRLTLANQASVLFGAVVTVATVGNVVIVVSQYQTAKENSKESTAQTQQLIEAANIQARAAQKSAEASKSFAASAQGISQGVQDAVGKLDAQVQQAEQARQSAEANAQRQLSETVKEFQREERPYLMPAGIRIDSLQAGKHLIASVREIDFGRTPAVHVRDTGWVFVGRDALSQVDKWFASFPKNMDFQKGAESTVQPGSPVDNSSTDYLSVYSIKVLDDSDLNLIRKTDYSFAIAGRIVYMDVEGRTYHTDYCYSRFATGATPTCPEHNEVK